MCRGDLEASCAKLHVNILIEDERNLPVGHGYNDFFAFHMSIALIIRIGADCCITQYGLRPGGGYHNIIFLSDYPVAYIVEF